MSPRLILVGTPAIDGSVRVEYVEALLRTKDHAKSSNISIAVHFVVQDSLIMKARNSIVAAFLGSNATDLVFIDSDIAWEPADFFKLIGYDAPIVAGIYRRKANDVSFAIQFSNRESVRHDRRSGLIEATRVGAGFLRIRRDALERMISAFPELRYIVKADSSYRYALFDTNLNDEDFCGEDFTFCDRWRSIGGTIWVDPNIVLKHIGSTAYVASLRNFLTT